jgi:BirA family biotin operon repressor/biotin-[acetyl-CoA-carboxylase] ligase
MRSAGAEPAPDGPLTRAFAACLPGGRIAGPLRAFGSVPSTQTVARAWAAAGAPEGAVVIADHQSAGRGRRGRAWSAPAGAALLFSVVLRPPLPVARWPELALAAGCAVAEAVEAVAGVATRLKWPNDVLAGARKLAGVLAEGVAGPAPAVVLGVGLNVSQADADWPPELAARAVSVAALAGPVSRPALLRAVLGRLDAWYGVLLARGFEPVRTAWRARGALGQRVVAPGLGEATAVDLAPGGGLLVRRPDGGTEVVVSADRIELEAEPPAGAAARATAERRPGGARRAG